MVWPVGQPDGALYQRAIKSRSVWKEVLGETGLWYEETGSLHAAYTDLEAQVMQELAEALSYRGYRYLTAVETLIKTEAINPDGLKGSLWSPDEVIIESRVAVQALPLYLAEKFGVVFHFNTAVTNVHYPSVYSGKNTWQADKIFVCSGADFETLYPEVYAANYFTKCKLQMLRIASQPNKWRIGPALCGGLSLIHYGSFKAAASLPLLKKHYEETLPDYLKWGIHVMVSQNGSGELTIGDTHEYGLHLDPFDRTELNDLVLDYLKTFARFKNWNIAQTWNGIYPKRTNGEVDFVQEVESGVIIVNGLGGAGMTLSFGLAEEVVSGIVAG
jgi:FAD dependent oxidoreductase TIGR03364